MREFKTTKLELFLIKLKKLSQLIKRKEKDIEDRKAVLDTVFEKFTTTSWNKLIILHGDTRCVLLTISLVQNIENWLGVENFKKSKECDNKNRKINIYKSIYQMQEVVKCYLLLILLVFYEHIHLGPNQPLRHLLCFSSRCKGRIRAYPSSKKIWLNDWENIIAH